MSILDDTPLENVPIDIFAAAAEVSTEAFGFSPDPEAAEQPMENPDVKELVDDTPVVEAEDITDTPQTPSPDLEPGEEDTLVSLELDATIDTEIASIESLYQVYESLGRIGGISRDDVYQVESLFPGVIPHGGQLNRFSAMTSPTGYDTSMEGIATSIIEKVKAILRYIADKLTGLVNWITKTKSRITGTNTDLKGSWNHVLNIAKKLDGEGKAKLLQVKYPKDEVARKSSTVQHFARLSAQRDFTAMGHLYLGLHDSILSNGSIGKEMTKWNNDLHAALKVIQTNLGRVQTNNYALSKLNGGGIDIGSERTAIARKYLTPIKMNGRTFEAAVGANLTAFEQVVTGLDAISREINNASSVVDKLQRGLRPEEVTVTKAVSELNRQIADAAAMYSVLNIYITYYRRYIDIINSMINKTQAALVPLGGIRL